MKRRSQSIGRPARAGRRSILVVAVLAAACVLPARASAHAVLQHTSPHENAAVTGAPATVRLDFNEPVEISFGAVRVYDEHAGRVDAGNVSYVGGRQSSVSVGLRDGLGRGVYTTTYRVLSADGHPVSGGFAFAVGEQVSTRRDTPQVADLLARSSAPAAVEALYGATRALHYAALLLLIGAVFFGLLVWPAGTSVVWPRRLLLIAAVVGLVCALLGIALQGALGAGVALPEALNSDVLNGSLGTRTGHAWLLRALAWALLTVMLGLFRGACSRRALLGLAVPIAALVATLPYAGHAHTQSPAAVLTGADVAHVLAAGAWLGGLVLLLVCFWPRGRRTVGDGAAAATARFSRLALPAIVVLVAAGSVQAWLYLGSVGALFNSTYGWALVAKIMLLIAIVALASANRRRTGRLVQHRAPDASRLRGWMRAEAVLALVVLAATATLVRAAPPTTITSGPIVRELDLGPLRLQLDVEPGTVGRNDYHLYLFDRRSGAQIDRVEQLTVSLVQREKDIGPIRLEIPRKGVAHYELRNATLGVAGAWQATITARVSAFDEYTATTTFEVRR